MTVSNKLTRACTGVGETKTEYEVVQTAFKKLHERFACNPFLLRSKAVKVTELLLVYTVHETKLLFLLKLHAVVAHLLALSRAVLTWRKRTLEFFAAAAQRNTETTAKFKFRTCIT